MIPNSETDTSSGVKEASKVPFSFERLLHEIFRPAGQAETSWRIVLVLLLTAFVPRLLLVLKGNTPCNDAYYYYETAERLRLHDYGEALSYLHLNVYPWVLLGVRLLGLSWVAAGIVVSIAASTLTVLPLYGWVRRMFDQKIAAISCLLFAIHPKMVLYGVEATRDSFFWLFYVSTLYFLWRGIPRVRVFDLICGGVTFALAATTRTEGLSLLVPLMGWSFIFMRRNGISWRRLVLIPALFAAMLPLVVVTLNLTLLRHHDKWSWVRVAHFSALTRWAGGESAKKEELESQGQIAKSPYQVPRKRQVQVFILDFGRNFTVPFLLLIVPGLWSDRKRILRSEYLLLFFLAMMQITAVWVRFRLVGDINGRYFLAPFLTVLPWCALGGMIYCRGYTRIWYGIWPTLPRWFLAPATAGTIMFLGFNLVATLRSSNPARENQREMGQWLSREFGPFQSVYMQNGSRRIGFYAAGENPPIEYTRLNLTTDPLPEIAILPVLEFDPVVLSNLRQFLQQRGMSIVKIPGFPKEETKFVLLLRNDLLAQRSPPGNEMNQVAKGERVPESSPTSKKKNAEFPVRPAAHEVSPPMATSSR